MAQLSGTFTGVVIDGQKLAEVLRGPNGPVMRDMLETAELVKREAQRRVGVYQPPDSYAAAHRRRRPGTLRDSIVKRVSEDRRRIAVQVGSNDPVAFLHHEGTVPHVIAARRRPLLVFYWPRMGRVVAFKTVNHPGTDPNRYLTDALAAVVRSRY